ncbi:dynamin family protein [Salegentibacter maritimus]|uniref:Dynamin family protein n=1 Tax=Salegentibacter maritimus TaxID=2794347 RepID=A0ABS0TJ28_9FLAO|nr:dynamin family protein [Salegentibacter maritimus]MBI6121021.1 dynamin family protein [Salegentibacter maritimus]
MKKIDYLINAANFLKLNDVLAELDYIKNRLNSETSELILPIVGEFSSGKTTFINKLTEGKKLETASKPTTSVIYEIYFGNNEEKAEIIFENEEIITVEDVASIKNDQLENVKRIKIYDTSKNIESNTILVDTPGLSSNDPKHLEALSSYLPNADAIFLFSDVNQQITNSLLDFVHTNNLLHLPLYLVLTKVDTKTEEEVAGVKEYISKHINLSIDNIICISSEKHELGEFHHLMRKIQDDKKNIINKALDYRLENVAEYLKTYIQNLIQNANSDSSIEDEIKSQRRKLERTLEAIDSLIQDIHNGINDIEYDAVRQFEKYVFSKLDSLIIKNSENIDVQARIVINSTANLVFANYQNEIKRKLFYTASQMKHSQLEIPLRSLESIDFSGTNLGELSYDMKLSEAGLGTVKGITTSIKIAAVIGAVVVTAGIAAGAAGAGAAGTAGAAGAGTAGTAGAAGAGTAAAGAAGTAGAGLATAATTATGLGAAGNLASKAGTVISTVDTVSDIASIQSNRNTRKKILEQARNSGRYFKEVQQNIKTYDDYNNKAGQMINPTQKLGFMETIVGSATDGIVGKPERKRIINSYLRNHLNPEFKNKLSIISDDLLRDIQVSLNQEAETIIMQLEEHLLELDNQRKHEKEEFNIYMDSLNQYKEQLT